MGKVKEWLEKRKHRGKRDVTHTWKVVDDHSFTTDLQGVWEEQRKSRYNPTDMIRYHPTVLIPQPTLGKASNKPKRTSPTSPTCQSSETLKLMLAYSARLPESQQRCKAANISRTTQVIKARPIFKLNGNVLFYLMDFLDYPSIVFLKLSCKTLHNAISFSHLDPSHTEQLTVLEYFKPSKVLDGQRFPEHLCQECMMWHSFEHMVLWPSPKPESTFADINEFKNATPRKCVRQALKIRDWHPLAFKTAEWEPGKPIDKNHTLCDSCCTPKSNSTKNCAWNCNLCSCCTDREKWSSYCIRCAKTLEGSYQDGSSIFESTHKKKNDLLAPAEKWKSRRVDVIICGSCGEYLFQIPGIYPKGVCRCGHASISAGGEHGTWVVCWADAQVDIQSPKGREKTVAKSGSLAERAITIVEKSDTPVDIQSPMGREKTAAKRSALAERVITIVDRTSPSMEVAKTGDTEKKELHGIPDGYSASAPPNPPLPLAMETCQTCFQHIEIRPGEPKSANGCRCLRGTLLTDQMQAKIKAHPINSSSTSMERETCPWCGLFSNITPGVTLMSKMCRCPGGPTTIKKPQLHIPRPSDRVYAPAPATSTAVVSGDSVRAAPVPAPIPAPTSSTSTKRERCRVCKGFANITTEVTLVSEMCSCQYGPLSIEWPEKPIS